MLTQNLPTAAPGWTPGPRPGGGDRAVVQRAFLCAPPPPLALHRHLTPRPPPALSSEPGLQGEAPGLPFHCSPIPPAASLGEPLPQLPVRPLHFFPPSDQTGLENAKPTPWLISEAEKGGPDPHGSGSLRRAAWAAGPLNFRAAQSLPLSGCASALPPPRAVSPAARGADRRPLKAALFPAALRAHLPHLPHAGGRGRSSQLAGEGKGQAGGRATPPPRRRTCASGRGEPPSPSFGGSSAWRNKKPWKARSHGRTACPRLGLRSAGATVWMERAVSGRSSTGVTRGQGSAQPGRQPGTRDLGLAQNRVSRGLTSVGHATRSFTQAAGRRACEVGGIRGET